MKKFAAPLLALAMITSTAYAGGPVVVAEEPVVEAVEFVMPAGLGCWMTLRP